MQFSVSFDSSSADLSSLTSAEQDAILATASAAGAIWAQYLTLTDVTLELAIKVDNGLFSGSTLATGGSFLFATDTTFGGERVYEAGTAVELRTGQDRNGSASDLTIGLTVNSIRNLLYFKTDPNAAVPNGRSDALSVFLHEIGHGLGIMYVDDSATYTSVFNTFVQNGLFTGANAIDAYGRAFGQATGLPLELGSLSHLRESSLLGSDLMSTSVRTGTNVGISAIDLAILMDLGVPIRLPGVTNRVPVVVTQNVQLARNQTVSLATLVSVSDPEGDAIAAYQLWDSAREPNSGYFVVNGVAKPAGTVISVTAAQFSQTYFVTGSVGDSLQIRATDGQGWSASDSAAWSPFSISVFNRVPVVTTSNTTKAHLQSFALSSLFSVSDADSDTITKYQLWDAGRETNSGYFTVGGIKQAAGTVIEITAAQLGQTSFVTGAIGDQLQIRAFDGNGWSAGDNAAWAPFAVGIAPNNAPVVTTSNTTKGHLQSFALSGLFSVSDADSDTITKYQLWDASREASSGYFTVNGAKQAAGTVIEITAAQLGQTSFVTGTTGDNLQIRAFDGIGWSAGDSAAWAPFTVTVPANNAPVVATSNTTKTHLQSLALSSLFSVSDADSDAITRYQLWDSTSDASSGYFTVGGIKQAAGTVIDITAAQLAQTAFVTGTTSDSLQIRAFDGIGWSAGDSAAWAPFTVTVPANSAPVVTTGTVNAMHGRTLALSSLISVSDSDGDTMTRYQLWDASREASSGTFTINGVAQAAGTVIEVSAAQLAQTAFVTGTTSDSLQIRTFDGYAWSAGDSAAWSPFNVAVTPYTAPTLTTVDKSATPNQSFTLSSLISVTDTDGDTMTRYQLWDSSHEAGSGHWMINNVAQNAGTVIDITAAQLAQTSFLAGALGDSLQVRAFDGISWTAADNAAWAPFHVNV